MVEINHEHTIWDIPRNHARQGEDMDEVWDGDDSEPPRKKAKESPFEALCALAGDISTPEQVSVAVDDTFAENATKGHEG